MLEPREDEELPPEIADLAAESESGNGERRGHALPRLPRRAAQPHRPRGEAALPPGTAALAARAAAAAARRARWPACAQLALDARGRAITQDIVPQIEERLKFLDHVGLGYLSLDRPTETLSGGEAQRIRLAAQLGSNLSGVLYVLDEPSIGLHARDNERLIGTLESLRDKGNTLLVVEHDDAIMERADRIIDLGPGAGIARRRTHRQRHARRSSSESDHR